MSDSVHQPPHYTSHPSGVECITIAEHLGFNLGNAVKYAWRLGQKDDPNEDRAKCCWYLRRAAEQIASGSEPDSTADLGVWDRIVRVEGHEPIDSPLAIVLDAVKFALRRGVLRKEARERELKHAAHRLEHPETTHA